MEKHKPNFEELKWEDLREEVAKLTPVLANIIDDLHSKQLKDKDYTLFKVRYPFGSKISDSGTLHIPNQYGRVVSISDKSIPDEIRNKLSYNPVPLSFVLKNTSEVFTLADNRFIPFKIFTPGEFFGTWELIDPTPFKKQAYNWSFTAGARSIFMLPKISESYSHQKLRSKYGVSLSPPKFLADHYEIFTKIATHPEFVDEWYNEIIFFPQKWLAKITETYDNSWSAFYFFILKDAWIQSLNWRNQLSNELIWKSLTTEINNKNMHPRHYLVNTVKHLISIGVGTTLGFSPACDSQNAPVSGLAKVYEKDYGIKYIPTIMQPTSLDIHGGFSLPVYYSLQHPSLLIYAPNNSHTRSAMKDLQEIKYLIEMLFSKLKKEKKASYELIKNISFDYFHTEHDKHGEIRLAENIPNEDKRFKCFYKDTKSFSNSASFLRGCIRISRKH